jgi:hypothetical protein
MTTLRARLPRPLLLVAALALAAGVSSCGEDAGLTDLRGVAAALTGVWSQKGEVPGSSFQFRLSVTDTTISGSGSFAIEAGVSGTMTVSGVISGSLIELVFHNTLGAEQHFNGSLVAADVLEGAFWQTMTGIAVDPIVVSYQRVSR